MNRVQQRRSQRRTVPLKIAYQLYVTFRLECCPPIRSRAGQFRLLVRPEQPCLARLPVHSEHDLRAHAWHSLQVIAAACPPLCSVRTRNAV